MRKLITMALAAAGVALLASHASAGDPPIKLACHTHGLMNCGTCQPGPVTVPTLAWPAPLGCCDQTLCDHARDTFYHAGAAVRSAALGVGHAARVAVQGVGALAGAGVNLLGHKIHRLKACVHNWWNAATCSVCAPGLWVPGPSFYPTVEPGCAACGSAPAAPPAPAPSTPQPEVAPPEVEQPKVPQPAPVQNGGQTGMLLLQPAPRS